MLSSDASYTATYNYSDADGNYTGLLQSETKTLPEAENLPLIPDANIQVTLYTYDANGNQLTVTDYEGHVKNYAYDGLNQLISYSDEKNTASYTYRMDGMRRSKTVNGTTITHIWVGGQIVADVTGNYTATCYVRGTNLLAQYDFNYGASDDYTYYLQNAHGDVTALLDTAGELTKSYVYDAFGVEQNIDNSDSNAFRYCGEYYDAETGTVYLRARYYNPVTGRFISRDSFTGKHEEPLSLNLYTYCHNNPIIAIDPSGHAWYHWAIGAAVVAGLAIATVATAGTFALGMMAIGSAAAGVSVGGATGVLAAATLASGTTLLGSAMWASANSETIEDFNEQGNWWTVAGVAGSAAYAGGMTYMMQKSTVQPQDTEPELPEFDGSTTQGVLVTSDGNRVSFSSGSNNYGYQNYPASKHVEGQSALYMRQNNISQATLYHNNTNGICNYCDKQLPTLLPTDASLTVVTPPNTVTPNQFWFTTKTYIGNANDPKLPK